MAVIVGEEHLDNPIIGQSENSLVESTPSKEENTINPIQETENMEVHKHPHHVTHKKKWGEYLLEFIMIFIAVFLGFIAENIREQKVEFARAKEYAISFVQDLQNDTTSINAQIKTSQKFVSITDSLLKLSKKRLEGCNAAEFSFYTRFMYWTVPISWNRSTFEQIKNSGNFRYFKNYQLLEKVMRYDASINAIESDFNNHQTRSNTLLNHINEIIDPGFHHNLSKYGIWAIDTISKVTKDKLFSTKVESIETKRPKIMEMLNMTVVQQRNLIINGSRLLKAKKLASELIIDLKKEYRIE